MSSIFVNTSDEESSNQKYFGNYLGIVIQNNDPDKGGKLKIWVPQVSPTIYNGWDDRDEELSFKFIGKN